MRCRSGAATISTPARSSTSTIPLAGVRAAGRILAVPFSKGSSTTTAVLLEAVRAGTAPAAIVTTGTDSFFALASIVADVMYGKPFPVIALDADDFAFAEDRRVPDGRNVGGDQTPVASRVSVRR